MEKTQKGTGIKKGIFPKETFSYDAGNHIFICPAGQILRRRKYFKKCKHYEYIASAAHVTVANFGESEPKPNLVELLSAMSDKMI